MFTGIIECTGKVEKIIEENASRIFHIGSTISSELKIDQSVAHNGVCLTVTEQYNNTHVICAIEETLAKTNLGAWQMGDIVNIERCLVAGSRLDGHIVQGHVDGTAVCVNRIDEATQHVYTFEIDKAFSSLIIEKGSVCVNGISLTCYHVTEKTFTVAIIPYTFSWTNIHSIHKGSIVNIEFDVVGKYIQRMQGLKEG